MAQRHAKVVFIQLTSSRDLVMTMRNFRTSKTQRSKTFRQLVLPIYALPLKEIAVRQQRHAKHSALPSTSQRRLQAVLPVLLIIFGIGGALYFGIQATAVSKATKLEPTKTFVAPPAPKKAVKAAPSYLPRSEPTHITIPGVGIDSPVISVGKDAEGGIEVPPVLEWVTGWYKYSPTPGEKGPSVIVGHVDSYKGVSVFWRLREVTLGTEVNVTRVDGTVAKFKVDALKQFDQANFPTQEVYSPIDHAGLRLITCGGSFNQQTESYTQNTVVYASLIP